ncbi:phage antirepressor KilAC domain-containing protein [Microbacterium sp. JC 701]|uniref:phage antirepressor KilAC domain-containing protein n=1 Tax=Microbacterium sp. JC 701 TaxID=2897389 RepID=UPI001E2DE334|nr:phage antirepressor KilAC domain-containing protein [Microbacterium sp. JC 701]MCD2170369.1 phage antirepressor KilAC domain-containing protein [Microbacterium sp. JC 701]
MTIPAVFTLDGADVRTVVLDGEPWFVGRDACDVVGIAKYRDALAQLAPDERASATVDTLGGPQQMTVVNEAGVNALLLISRSPRARLVQRWIAHDVLPSIRRTGAYVAPQTPEQRLAAAVLEAQRIIEARDVQVAELTPRAEAWDELASADGDFSVADAAKMLARAGVETGPQRLFEQLAGIRWIFRGGDGKWRAYATYVSEGYLTERPQSHEHPRTKERVLDAPQVRVTMRGLERLRIRLGVLRPLEVAS